MMVIQWVLVPAFYLVHVWWAGPCVGNICRKPRCSPTLAAARATGCFLAGLTLLHWLDGLTLLHWIGGLTLLHWLVSLTLLHWLVSLTLLHWLVSLTLLHWLVRLTLLHWLVGLTLLHWSGSACCFPTTRGDRCLAVCSDGCLVTSGNW